MTVKELFDVMKGDSLVMVDEVDETGKSIAKYRGEKDFVFSSYLDMDVLSLYISRGMIRITCKKK